MITIIKKTEGTAQYYDFTVVKNDTGQFIATPKVNGSEYELQEGDSISFRLSKDANRAPILEIIADENKRIALSAEDSEKLSVGDYYADITLNYANGNRDTFVKIPVVKGKAISNFHVTYGV